MPQILVDYSAELTFDRLALAKELHGLIADVIDTTVPECKTVFRPASDHLVGDGSEGRAVVLAEIKILAGRGVELRAELSAQVLDLLQRHVDAPAAVAVQITELDRATYRLAMHPGR
ncbi:5-carboxymethyl-2-hydroxymuconate Delta-isomerase [Yinghuangia soli]|uniref:Isomerase n=1 Tax=Yinghuangia soli TaxID=2908204 RepID=A0AA41Q868_9ACTN|nr:isomerase [Yinghuangia soli]MCF2533243.1 isomerase [Yinghuangia soli]